MSDKRALNRAALALKALGHRDRLRIIAALAAGEACVCHLTSLLRLRQATVSQHLAVLKRAGLVRARREGTNVFYRVADPAALQVLKAVGVGAETTRARVEECRCPACTADRQHPLPAEQAGKRLGPSAQAYRPGPSAAGCASGRRTK